MYFRMPRVIRPFQAELGLQGCCKCCILQNKLNKKCKLNNNFFKFFFLIFNLESVVEFFKHEGRVNDETTVCITVMTNKFIYLQFPFFFMNHIFYNIECHQHKAEDQNQWELLLNNKDKFVIVVWWVGVSLQLNVVAQLWQSLTSLGSISYHCLVDCFVYVGL